MQMPDSMMIAFAPWKLNILTIASNGEKSQMNCKKDLDSLDKPVIMGIISVATQIMNENGVPWIHTIQNAVRDSGALPLTNPKYADVPFLRPKT